MSSCSKTRAREAEAAALAVKGVTKSGGAGASAGIGGMVLVTSHGFRGAYLALAPRRLDDRDRRRRHRHGARLRFLLGAACCRSRQRRRRSAAAPASAPSSGSIRARSTTRRVPVVFDPRVAGSLVGHLAGAINGASIARKTSFLQDSSGEQAVRVRHPHHRRSAAAARPALAAVRRRGRRRRGARLVDDGVLKTWLLDCATARELGLDDHRPRRSAASRRPPSPGATNLHLEPARDARSD